MKPLMPDTPVFISRMSYVGRSFEKVDIAHVNYPKNYGNGN